VGRHVHQYQGVSTMSFLNRERLTVYPRIFLILYLLIGGYWILGGWFTGGKVSDRLGKPAGADFVQYWAASHLTLAGEAATVYDPRQFIETERQVAGGDYPVPWLYPPTFLLILLPLALLPYLISLCVWMAVTLIGYLGVLYRIAPHRLAFWLALAFPGTFINLINGQNGFLSAGLLGGGLLLLDSQPWIAGCLLGLLSYKPHLAALVPLALAAGCYWQALAAMLITVGGLVGLSALILGSQVWLAFWHNLPLAMQLIRTGSIPIYKMPTTLAAVLEAGGGLWPAQVLQGLVTVGMIVLVVLAWRRRLPLPLRGSILVLAALLATPYAFPYDLALLALPLAWLGREVLATGWLPWEQPVMVLAWLLPLLVAPLAKITHCQVGPPILLGFLGIVMRRAFILPAWGVPAAGPLKLPAPFPEKLPPS
jgi:hypothetical protein